jgi:hypothetical protein
MRRHEEKDLKIPAGRIWGLAGVSHGWRLSRFRALGGTGIGGNGNGAAVPMVESSHTQKLVCPCIIEGR